MYLWIGSILLGVTRACLLIKYLSAGFLLSILCDLLILLTINIVLTICKILQNNLVRFLFSVILLEQVNNSLPLLSKY